LNSVHIHHRKSAFLDKRMCSLKQLFEHQIATASETDFSGDASEASRRQESRMMRSKLAVRSRALVGTASGIVVWCHAIASSCFGAGWTALK
jgi:hypothetical protein